MRKAGAIFSTVIVTAAILVGTAPPAAASRLVSSFDIGSTSLVSIGVDSQSVFVYAAFATTIGQFSKTGQPLATIPVPGARSNDFDIDIPENGFTLGSGNVPAGGLFITNGETTPQQLFGLDRAGAITGQLDFQSGTYVGGTYHSTRGSVFLVDWTADVIREINATTGAVVNEFPVMPTGSPSFDVFYGDVAFSPLTGNLYVVSSSQAYVRELTPTGGFVRDWDVSTLAGVGAGMAGIDMDPATNNAWIATNASGVVYEVALEPSAGDRIGCDTGDTCGTGGDDDLSANDGTITGGAGNDTIEGIIDETTTELIVEAGTGNDVITLDIQDATQTVTVRVLGGGGADTISVPRNPGALTPNLLGGDGNDVIKVYTPTASPRVQLAQGSALGRYVIDAGGGSDRVTAGIAADRIKSAAGNDTVDGGAGNDTIDAGGGGDDLEGGPGNDSLGGGGGNDVLHGGDGANNFAGGTGDDTCLSDTKQDRFSGCERIRRNHRRNHGQL